MLNFLRKLRRNNMNSKYLKYAIGEIFLVVVGILIALSINNWNEARKDKNREHDLLNQLSIELTDTRTELSDDVSNLKLVYALTDSIIYYQRREHNRPFQDYFMPIGEMSFYNNTLLFGSKSTYTTLESVGLEIIENSTLRNTIADLYGRRFKRVEMTENVIFDYHDRIVAMMEKSFDSQYYPPLERYILLPSSYKAYMENPEMNNALSTLQNIRRVLLERYEAVDSMAIEVQRMIKLETNKDL